jgi:hypothetical protein
MARLPRRPAAVGETDLYAGARRDVDQEDSIFLEPAMFDMSSRPSVPPDNRSQLVAAGAMVAIALAVTLYGPTDTIADRLPIPLLLVGSLALGAAFARLIKRHQSRTRARRRA